MKVDFFLFGRAVLLFYSTEKKNLAKVVISMVDLLTHVILARFMKVDFLPFGRAVLLFYSTEKKNLAKIVISMVDLLPHVIFSSIYESRFFPFWKSSSPFLLHGKEKSCQNRNQHGRLAPSRDF